MITRARSGFREQLEALLVVPSAHTRVPARPLPAPPSPPAAPPGGELHVAPVSTAAAPDVPTFLQPTSSGLAETGVALDLPIPRAALPFVEPSKVVGGPRLAPLPPPPDPRPLSFFTGTVEGQVLPVPGRVLPFAAPTEDLAATALLGDLPVPREPLPFVDATEPVLEGLSLQAHAALCADLAARPVDAERIFAARGLADAHRRRAVNDAWLTYLGTNAAAYARWQDLYRRHASGAR